MTKECHAMPYDVVPEGLRGIYYDLRKPFVLYNNTLIYLKTPSCHIGVKFATPKHYYKKNMEDET